MIELTEEQIDFVHNDLISGGLESTDLVEDVLDHVCCFIEESMENGIDFDKAFELSKGEVCPDEGWEEIQIHTDYLIKFKHHIIMRKFMHIVGIVGALFIFIGAIFKMQHWPGAMVVLLTGYAIVSLIQLPIMLVTNYRESTKNLQKIMHVIAFVSGFSIISGVIWKVAHWPGAGVMLFGGVLLFILIFLPLYLINSNKDQLIPASPLNTVIVLLVVSSLFVAFGTKNETGYFIRHIDEFNRSLEATIEPLKANRKVEDSVLLLKIVALEADISEMQGALPVYLENGDLDKNFARVHIPVFTSKKDIMEGNSLGVLSKINFKELNNKLNVIKSSLDHPNAFGYQLPEGVYPHFNGDDRTWADSYPAMIVYYKLTQLEKDLAALNY